MRSAIIGAVALTAGAAVFAAAQKELPPGTPLLGPDTTTALTARGPAGDIRVEVVDVAGQPFTKAYRVSTLRRPDLVYSVALSARTAAPVQKGDVVLLSFMARAVETSTEAGEAYAQCVFEQASEPYSKSIAQRVPAGKEWKRFDLPFAAANTYAAGGAQLCFQLGYGPQVIEIADLRLTSYGKEVKLSDLPRTRFTYPGGAPNAAWRKDALARIEQIRKGDLSVSVVDAAGKPVPGAEVSVKMKRHAYAFGSAVAADQILAQTPDAERYRETIKRCFNRVVMENDLKWPGWEGNPQRAVNGVRWLREQGIEVRGHCLVWPSWKNTPRDLAGLKDQPDALRKRIADHVTSEATAMRGQLVEWDVINEPFSNKDVQGVLGDDIMVDWFRLARQADPDVRLFLNDYPILGSGTAHWNHFLKTLRFLIDKGAPIGGIGVQCHYGGSPAAPADLLRGLDELGKLNLPVEATEFDVDTADEELQADYMRDHLIAWFSHPATNGVVMWGFWEGRHWKPAAALWRRDWSIKPCGEVWTDLVLKQWWTDVQGRSDAQGAYQARGFLGDYEVTATADGKTKTIPVTLKHEGISVKVELK